jgi:hypothetical protein
VPIAAGAALPTKQRDGLVSTLGSAARRQVTRDDAFYWLNLTAYTPIFDLVWRRDGCGRPPLTDE